MAEMGGQLQPAYQGADVLGHEGLGEWEAEVQERFAELTSEDSSAK
jgi:hypothetical protein